MNKLEVLLQSKEGDWFEIGAPAVGKFYARVASFEIVREGQIIGELEQLGQRLALTLPKGTMPMRVSPLTSPQRGAPKAYGEALMRLQPLAIEDEASETARKDPELPEGAVSVESPTEGHFYRSPSPDAPPFISPGQKIRSGAVVGLVEVMKSFYEIHFEAPAPSKSYRVIKILAENDTALPHGEIIAWLAPSDEP